ncbi:MULTISPECIES: prolyl oligopeptidase family serine peptidase [unclassified Rhizobium]|uniref:alpha/beta hydrolase n=1 Tax=unclassified Rhizobium TaxID=2613769 RepID=UPI000B326CDB|nr:MULTISPECIES: prolyl oligopeptidase family serine peptidase [unclassified Rhizobium]
MTTSSIAASSHSVAVFAFVALSAFLLSNATSAANTRLRPTPEAMGVVDKVGAKGGQSHEVADVAPARPERRDRLVILFHGIGGRGAVMSVIGHSWTATLPNTRFVAPDAPSPHRSGGRQWFPVDDQVMKPDRIRDARRAFDDLVSGIVKREGFDNALERVAFVGVSQGAIMALDAVTTGRWKVGAVVSFAGLLALPPTASSTQTPILLMHGAADRTIPPIASVAAKRQLAAAGYDVTLKTFPDVGHTISSDEAREAAQFLHDRWK